jgi:hypothetical protein
MRNIKFWIGLGIVVGCMACNRSATPANATVADSVAPTMLDDMPTTALPVMPLRVLPAGLVLDSTIATDTVLHYRTTIYYPQSATDTVLNAQIRDFCAGLVAANAPDTKVDDAQLSVWPILVTQKGDLLSMLFQDQTFYTGGAHFTHGYTSLNIDLPTHGTVSFEDLIRFIGNKPRIAFCEMVNGQNQKSAPLTPEMLKQELDFAIDGDLLQLCFDDFELGPSQAILSVALRDAQAFFTARAIKILNL